MNEPIRLAKRLAHDLGCSRREAEQFIEGGWVSVDGIVVEDPAARVAAQQEVRLDPAATAETPTPVSILLHKPAGAVLDAAGMMALLLPEHRSASDRSGLRLLRRHFRNQQLLAGLPAGASGLVVSSQDGRITRRLLEDAARIEQEILIDVGTELDAALLARLQREAAARHVNARISRQSEKRLRIAAKGRAASALLEICMACGLQVTSERRIRLGRIALAGLAPGEWRFLRSEEWF
jgi:23S rRNA pseudouridine2604 synthase